jgi:hypothetical protein
MRMMFGLVGVLVLAGVIAYWWGPGGGLDKTHQDIKTGQKMTEAVSQIAGRDTQTGGRAWDSAELEILTSNGRPASLLVASVVPGGAYERYFGLKKDDVIRSVEYQGYQKAVKDMDDAREGRDQLSEAFQRRGTIVVVRGGKEMTLPLPVVAPAPTPGAPAAAPAQPDQRTPLQRQLDAITAPR